MIDAAIPAAMVWTKAGSNAGAADTSLALVIGFSPGSILIAGSSEIGSVFVICDELAPMAELAATRDDDLKFGALTASTTFAKPSLTFLLAAIFALQSDSHVFNWAINPRFGLTALLLSRTKLSTCGRPIPHR